MTLEKYGKKTETDFDESQYQFFTDNYPKLVTKNLKLENQILKLKTKIDMLEHELKHLRFIENERQG